VTSPKDSCGNKECECGNKEYECDNKAYGASGWNRIGTSKGSRRYLGIEAWLPIVSSNAHREFLDWNHVATRRDRDRLASYL
jgi:hypothetical protein